MTATITLHHLNRSTLARQMLLERAALDLVTAIERLAGMQAQHSPSPYIGLWSRVEGFGREHLEDALRQDRVYKATLMRGTLHLVPACHFDRFRVVTRDPGGLHTKTSRQLVEVGADVDRIRAELIELIRERPRKRSEIQDLIRHLLPPQLPFFSAWAMLSLSGDFLNLPDDGLFGYFGGVRLRLAPPVEADPLDAARHVAAGYFGAFGPASRADLAAWSGKTVTSFADALDSLELVTFRSEDGRTLYDLPDAPRPDPDIPVPVRFLPKWDNLLLAYARRERVLPEEYRKTIIRKNGDVLPTFLVDGVVAGTWDAPLKGRATITLSPLRSLSTRERQTVENEAESLLAWLRPDRGNRDLLWNLP